MSSAARSIHADFPDGRGNWVRSRSSRAGSLRSLALLDHPDNAGDLPPCGTAFRQVRGEALYLPVRHRWGYGVDPVSSSSASSPDHGTCSSGYVALVDAWSNLDVAVVYAGIGAWSVSVNSFLSGFLGALACRGSRWWWPVRGRVVRGRRRRMRRAEPPSDQ